VSALLPLHVRHRRGNPVQHTFDVDVDSAVPVVDLPTLERRMRHDAGVVEDDVDASVLLHRGVDQRLDLRGVGDVGHKSGRRAFRAGDLIDQRVKPLGAPRSEYDGRPALGEMSRRGVAQAAAGAGNDDNLACDVGSVCTGDLSFCGFHFTAPLRLRGCSSIHFRIRSAICRLFLSCIIMWLLPRIPRSGGASMSA
jgi:hypothetical protein